MKRKRNNRIWFYSAVAWFLVGIIVLWAACYTYLENNNGINFSFDNNDVYEVNENSLNGIEAGKGLYRIPFGVDLSHKTVNYLMVYVDGVGSTEANISFEGGIIDEEGEYKSLYYISRVALHDGKNYIELTNTDFTYATLYIEGPRQPVVKQVQFRETKKCVDLAKALPAMGIALIGYLLASAILFSLSCCYRKKRIIREKDSAKIRENEAQAFDPILKGFVAVGETRNDRRSASMRTIIFFLLPTLSFLIQLAGGEKYYNQQFQKYFVVQTILVILAFFNLPDRNHLYIKRNIDREATVVCSTLALFTLFSDCLVDKQFRFSGIGIFISLFIFGYCWIHRDNNETYIKDFERGIQWFIVVLVILICTINDPVPDGRFSGPIANPSILALYAGTIWALLLGSIENHILNNNKRITIAISLIEMAIVLLVMILSQATTPLVSVVIVTALWAVRLLLWKKGAKATLRISITISVIVIFFFVGIVVVLRNLQDSTSIRMLSKLQSANISSLLSSRNYYWKEYIRHMNLFGHSKKPYLWDHRILPHNAIIGMAYMYGVPCTVPYITMIIMAVEKSWRYANTGLGYAAVPFYCIVSFVIMSMADNVEQPYVWLPWIACYLMMAPILLMPVDDIEALRISRLEQE